MGSVKQWILSLCVSSVVCSLIETLFPTGKMKASAKLVMSLFFITVLISPSFYYNNHFNLPTSISSNYSAVQTNNNYSYKVSNMLTAKSQEVIRLKVSELLTGNNILFEEIRVTFNSNLNNDNNFVIDLAQLDIYITNIEDKAKVQNLIKSSFAIDCNVFAQLKE